MVTGMEFEGCFYVCALWSHLAKLPNHFNQENCILKRGFCTMNDCSLPGSVLRACQYGSEEERSSSCLQRAHHLERKSVTAMCSVIFPQNSESEVLNAKA